MAQINNNGNNQVNKSIDINHSWAIKELTRNDALATNQWPIKVIRDENKQTKMEIRSITDLNKSFEGTRHNLLQCPKVKSRYTLLYDELMKHSQDISNISHLAITYDTVYYMVNKEVKKSDGNIENKPEFKCFTFGTNIFNEDDIERVTNGVLLSSGYFDYIIKNDFNNFNEAYKQLQAESKQMKLKDTEFRAYVKRLPEYNAFGKTMSAVLKNRQKLKVIDNVKPLIDVLKSELNFTNLEYLFFIPYPNEAVDYSELIKQRLLGKPYNLDYRRVGVIGEELKKVPSLSIEEPGFNSFVDELRKKKHNRTIRKAYFLRSNEVTSKAIYNLFLNVKNPDVDLKPIYISDAELVREKRNAAKDAKDNAEVQELMDVGNKIKEEIKNSHSDILDMLVIMNTMTRISDSVHKKGLAINNVEYGIWISQYDISTLKDRIEAVYTHRREKDDNGQPVVVELYPLAKIFAQIQEKIGMKFSMDWETELGYFYTNIRPTYFSDETLGIEKLNISKLNMEQTDSENVKEVVTNLKNLKKIMDNIRNNFMFLLEVVAGVQYATFGVFMKRYGIGGVPMTKMLITDLVNKYSNKSFYSTEHVNYSANLAFYTIMTSIDRLKKSNSETDVPAVNMKDIGSFAYFVKTYLEAISGKELVLISHKDKFEKYENLIKVSSDLGNILDTCINLVHLDAESQENRNNRYNALMMDIESKKNG